MVVSPAHLKSRPLFLPALVCNLDLRVEIGVDVDQVAARGLLGVPGTGHLQGGRLGDQTFQTVQLSVHRVPHFEVRFAEEEKVQHFGQTPLVLLEQVETDDETGTVLVGHGMDEHLVSETETVLDEGEHPVQGAGGILKELLGR